MEANRDIVDLAAHVQQHEAAVAELRQGLAAAHPGAAAADRGQAGHAVGGMSQVMLPAGRAAACALVTRRFLPGLELFFRPQHFA